MTCLLSHNASLLLKHQIDDDNLNINQLDLVQLHRFVHSCFIFSKCDYIESSFNNLRITALNGSLCRIIVISINDNLSPSTSSLICHHLLYHFETAYRSQLQSLHEEEEQNEENAVNNYSVHDIDRPQNENRECPIFHGFQYLIDHFLTIQIPKLEAFSPSEIVMVLISNDSESAKSILFEHSNSENVLENE